LARPKEFDQEKASEGDTPFFSVSLLPPHPPMNLMRVMEVLRQSRYDTSATSGRYLKALELSSQRAFISITWNWKTGSALAAVQTPW